MTRSSRRNAPQFQLELAPRELQPVAVKQYPATSESSSAASVGPDEADVADDGEDDPSCGGAAHPQQKNPHRWNFSATSIVNNLWLGSYTDAMNAAELNFMGIRRILNVAGECQIEKDVEAHFETKHVQLRDHSDEDISATFDTCCEFIKEGIDAGEGVLVHCRMGVSRSTTIVLAYLMRFGTDELHSPMTYNAAFDFVKGLRPEVSPNLGFVLALHDIDRRRGFEDASGFEDVADHPFSPATGFQRV